MTGYNGHAAPSTLINPRDLGRAFRPKRRALGKTQQDIADGTPYRRQTIVDNEAGRNVSVHTVFAAALAALGRAHPIVDARSWISTSCGACSGAVDED
ncbi:MAG: hypothetical protein IPH76_04435 [Xanthomonadales bacterium]|nr:hypothetical protein [Xanthomonadales bacterium]